MYMPAYTGNPRNPRHPGDIGDIGDIFRKSLKLLDFLSAHAGDISGDIFWNGDKSPQAPPARPPNTFQNGSSSEIHDRHGWIYYRPNFARKKSLTACFKRASSRVSLPTGGAFFAAGCCDSCGPFFAEKVSKHDFSFKIQVRKYF